MAGSISIYSRLYLSNELKTTDENDKELTLDCNQIKSISSGGDSKKARENYQNAFSFELQGNMCLFMNQLAKLSHEDAKQNLYQFNYNTIFVDKIADKERRINELGEGCKYMLKDDTVKELIENENIQNAFIQLIIQNYGDNIPNKTYNDFDNDENGATNKIDELFECTLSTKDRIKIKDFNAVLTSNSIKISKSALKLYLGKNGVGEGKFPERRAYKGIKLIEKNINEQESPN